MRMPKVLCRALCLLACLMPCLTGFAAGTAVTQTHPQTYTLDIPSQKLNDALQALALASRHQLFYQADLVDGKSSPALKGQFTAEEAIQRLLAGTNLVYEITPSAVVFIRPRKAGEEVSAAGGATALRLARVQAGAASAVAADEKKEEAAAQKSAADDSGERVPEVLVRGSRALNMDIQRSVNDAQPYVIFDRQTIQQSGAINLEDFFKNRLTMNTVAGTNSQNVGATRSTSQINLRGLGTNQTLILVDGHRIAAPNNLGTPLQPDLNGIPLDAIERIEVLPTTASGIYGGSATGGVVNVIMRRDYNGMEAKVSYETPFDTDAALTRMDFNTGFALEGGRTRVMISGSFSDQNIMQIHDRDFLRRGRDKVLANRPAALLPPQIPPLGYLPNFRTADGSPLFGAGTASYASVPQGYAGGGGTAAFLPNAGKYNLDLANSAQGDGGLKSLVNNPRVESGTASVRREFGSRVQVFLDLAASNNNGRYQSNPALVSFVIPATAPNNPFGKTLILSAPATQDDATYATSVYDRRAILGAIVDLPKGWRLETDYTMDRTRMWSESPGSLGDTSAAIADGTLNFMRDTNLFPLDLAPYTRPGDLTSPIYTTLKDATLRVAGPLWTLPAGEVVLSTSLEDRREAFSDSYLYSGGFPFYIPDRSQSVRSGYVELRVPLVSSLNRLPGVEAIDLQLAGRRDDYTVVGSTSGIDPQVPEPIVRPRNNLSSTNPTFGLRYKPFKDLMLRGSYGTGFLPPGINQLVSEPDSPAFTLGRDPRRGNTLVVASNRTGGNPDLRPEKSTSWSAGLVFSPHFIEGLRVSIDYSAIEKRDNISSLTNQQIIANEADLPGRVVRGDPAADTLYHVGIIQLVNNTLVNIARARIAAYDMQVDYHLDTTAAGSFDFFALATRQMSYETQLLPISPLVENVGRVGTVGTLLRLKGNAGVAWNYGNWTAGWNMRYFDSYLVGTSAAAIQTQGNHGVVPSQTYHDLFAAYRFGRVAPYPALANTEIQLGIKNVFNTTPPFDSSYALYYSLFADPRLASYSISLKKAF